MFKRILCMILCVGMILSMLCIGVFAAEEVSGEFMQKVNQLTWEDVLPADFTPISTEAELEAIERNPAGRYILMEDIEIASFEILCSNDTPFTGVLEGNGHTISGIEIDITGNPGSTYYWGLFSTIRDARIANLKVSGSLTLTIEDYKNSGTCYIGGLVGQAIGNVNIINCVNAVEIHQGPEDGFKYQGTGGIVGGYESNSGESNIASCRNVADFYRTDVNGGIVGRCLVEENGSLNITNCRNDGDILVSTGGPLTGFDCGGIIGELLTYGDSTTEIYACMNTGKIDIRGNGGGIVGSQDGSAIVEISSCANTGDITASGGIGGIVSYTDEACYISDCINTGLIHADESQSDFSGIVSRSYMPVKRCINTGNISGSSYNAAIACNVVCDTQEEVYDMLQDCYWLDNDSIYTNTLYRSWRSGSAIDSTGMMSAEDMKKEELFENYDFPAIWTMDESRGHPFPTALLDATLDNTYQMAYIQDTLGIVDEYDQYMSIFGGSGDGSLAGVVGDTYTKSLLDEVNQVWSGAQFVESIANYSIPTTTDYDVLLADLLGGTVGEQIFEEHITSKTLSFFSELITLSGAELDAANVLATEKYLDDMSELPSVFGDPAKKLLDSVRNTVLKDIPYEKFSGYVSKIGGVVNIAGAAAAGCSDVWETFDFIVLCNANQLTVNSYGDLIMDAAAKAKGMDGKEGGDLYKSANSFVTQLHNNLDGNPKALYDAIGGSVANLTTTGGFTILEGVLKLNKLNPVLLFIDGVKTGITIGMPVADALTNMDQISYYGRMMEMCCVLSKGLFQVVQERKDAFAHSLTIEDAEALNAASNLYLNLQILACDYAIGYSNAIASSSMSNTFNLNKDDLVAIIQLQQHKADLLQLQKNSKNIYIGQDGSISGFIANCPVTVVVTDSNRNEISRMTTGSITTAQGYGGSYMLLGNGGEHKAGLYDPDKHTVTIIGEETGTMDLVVYHSEDGKLTQISTYEDVPIEKGVTYTVADDHLNGKTDIQPTETEYLDPETHPHTYKSQVVAPTCIQEGYTTYTCICGSSYVDNYVSATGIHTYSGNDDASCNVCGATRLILPTAPTGADYTPMYRLYNPNSGEHFYTGSGDETRNLVNAGWQYEGVAWNAPTKTGAPVYRLYNPNSGDHHYTMSLEERDMLVGYGWQYEGVCWNSASADNLPLYRLYNPNADCGSHHYTGSTEERDNLVNVGWIYEGIGWFGLLN